MNDENCRDFLCKEKIHSSSEWKKAALRTKKALQNSGIAEFEAHPEYRKITDCKPDDDNYPSSEDCNRQARPRQGPSSRPAATGKRGRCPKGTTFNKRTQNCEPKNRRGSPTRRASPVRPAASAKRGRCPKGTRRNKRTGNCEPKNRRGSPVRPASPVRPGSPKSKRCPKGTRRNKRTKNCEPK